MKKKGRFLYHATVSVNRDGILNEGLKRNWDGVYLADSEDNAMKFMAFRFEATEFTVFKIDVARLDETLLHESFDHSEVFFKCKAWVYEEDIARSAIVAYTEYGRVVAQRE